MLPIVPKCCLLQLWFKHTLQRNKYKIFEIYFKKFFVCLKTTIVPIVDKIGRKRERNTISKSKFLKIFKKHFLLIYNLLIVSKIWAFRNFKAPMSPGEIVKLLILMLLISQNTQIWSYNFWNFDSIWIMQKSWKSTSKTFFCMLTPTSQENR